jgi:hypothetical protein
MLVHSDRHPSHCHYVYLKSHNACTLGQTSIPLPLCLPQTPQRLYTRTEIHPIAIMSTSNPTTLVHSDRHPSHCHYVYLKSQLNFTEMPKTNRLNYDLALKPQFIVSIQSQFQRTERSIFAVTNCHTVSGK